MVYWITGRANSGKTTYARRLKAELEMLGASCISLDGDEVRNNVDSGNYDDVNRMKHILRVAGFAAILERQGYTVIISLVSPKKSWRMMARKKFARSFLIYMPGGTLWDGTTYEEPDTEEMMAGV